MVNEAAVLFDIKSFQSFSYELNLPVTKTLETLLLINTSASATLRDHSAQGFTSQ